MARGWESKAVEDGQQDRDAGAPAPAARPRGNHAQDAERQRQVQGLTLQRERILNERTASPHRRTALETALADIEEKLAELGWTIHL